MDATWGGVAPCPSQATIHITEQIIECALPVMRLLVEGYVHRGEDHGGPIGVNDAFGIVFRPLEGILDRPLCAWTYEHLLGLDFEVAVVTGQIQIAPA
jgi:hypothetical protein